MENTRAPPGRSFTAVSKTITMRQTPRFGSRGDDFANFHDPAAGGRELLERVSFEQQWFSMVDFSFWHRADNLREGSKADRLCGYSRPTLSPSSQRGI